MKQITEDYVSFEVAKLLKEKGFDGRENHVHQGYFNENLIDYTLFGFCDGEILLAPTLQMALKWLREIHKIHINLDIHWLHFANRNGWMYVIERILDNGVDYVDSKGDSSDLTFFSTYEEACERAIKYVLENLI
jgi:hypothetical protein